MDLTIELPQDSEGFIDYECPFCERRFRLPINVFQDDNIQKLYCPYCGLYSAPSEFGTKELQQLIEETVAGYVQDELKKSLSKLARNSKGLIKYKPGEKIVPQNVILDERINDKIHCDNCDVKFKVDDGTAIMHTCPICGDKII